MKSRPKWFQRRSRRNRSFNDSDIALSERMSRDGILTPQQTERAFERERARVERNGQCFSLAVFRLEEAPTAGSLREQLADTALVLRKRVRTYDEVGFVAGDSLAVLLPETNGEDTWIFVDGALEELSASGLKIGCEVYTYPHSQNGDAERGTDGSAEAGAASSVPSQFGAPHASPHAQAHLNDLDLNGNGSADHAHHESSTASNGQSAPASQIESRRVEGAEGSAHGLLSALSATAVLERPSRLRMVASDRNESLNARGSDIPMGIEQPGMRAYAGSSAIASLPMGAPSTDRVWLAATRPDRSHTNRAHANGTQTNTAKKAPSASPAHRPVHDLAPFFEERLPLHRRAVDILVSGSALLVLSPIIVTGALLVKATSPGPIIFAQERAGRGGRPFQFYKLRSMYKDAEDRKNALRLVNEKDGPIFKIKNDPRITPVGKVLRKFSIDELPQLFNVLKGDMTLVGPRPPVMDEVREYETWQRQRLDITGGITCIWQVSGRSEVTFREWMRMDVRYRKKRSLKLDIKLVLKTFGAVFSGKGAY